MEKPRTFSAKGKEWVRQRDAVSFIRAVCYAKENKKIAGNTIRHRIKRAKGRLVMKQVRGQLCLEADSFFQWAVHQCPAMRKVGGMPDPIEWAVSATSKGTGIKDKMTGAPTIIPGDPEKLRRNFLELSHQLEVLRKEHAQLRQQCAEQKEELEHWRNKDAEFRKKSARRGRW